MEEHSKQFHEKCGEILRLSLGIETTLDFFIANYFSFPQSYRTFLFNDQMLVNLNFSKKVEIFEAICKEEEIDRKKTTEILKAINYVKEIRNRIAHGQGIINSQEEGIVLQKRYSVTYKKDELKVTKTLVDEVEKNRLFAVQEIMEIHTILSDPNRIKPPKIF